MGLLGGALTQLSNTLAVSATAAALAGGPSTPQRLADAGAHGYTTAFWASAALLAAGAAVSGTLLHAGASKNTPAREQDRAIPAEPAQARSC